MARRPTYNEPKQVELTIDQIRRGITSINRRIKELEEFDPNAVGERGAPEVDALEASLEGTIVDVFGHNTVEYKRYISAARLDNGPITLTTSWIEARGGYSQREDFHQYLIKGKQASLLLLAQAVRWLEEKLSDQESSVNFPVTTSLKPNVDSNKIFIVHGHDDAPKQAIARFIEKLGLEAIILHERANKGRTLITKLSEEADAIKFAIVLMTPDDHGKPIAQDNFKLRARQNVIFELGFFIGKLGSSHVAALVKGEIETPSDYDGVAYISLDKEDWKTKLAQELQAVGFEIDWNKLMRG
ncbi:MAG: nucleotide-binding protein containing TIR-like domain-like [Rickettsiaceae bacterium]|jgi:predicted nucleotide-binding protein|nr:nucleotide-binding protein containing TIR-like domain-like [Rickettsiaceae bacterium]